MIHATAPEAVSAGLLRRGHALVQRFGDALAELPSAEAPREWVESLVARLPAAEACAALEHLFGVVPLLEAYFEPRGAIAEAAAGERLGALALFTPTPVLGWGAAAVAAEPCGGGLLLHGEVRIASPAADGSVALARLGGQEHRLIWVDHDTPGVERRGARAGGPIRGDFPCWLALEGVAVEPDLVSRPVTLAPGAGYFRKLEAYAGVWALAASILAGDGVRRLRRAARTTLHRGTAFSAAQLVAMDITELEIEAELAAAAARGRLALAAEDPAHGGLVAAAAAARVLATVAAKAVELRDLAGLEPDEGLERPPGTLTAFLGGPLMVESELARALGIQDLPDQETSG